MRQSFVISNKVEELTVLASNVDEIADRWNLSAQVSMNIDLALEEAVSNIIFYAFTDKENHEIRIDISLSGKDLKLRIEDEGIPFDPTIVKKPDINLPAEERPVGGLGIFLVSEIMDSVSYTREDGKNILVMNKKI